jgi:hypothetical protein
MQLPRSLGKMTAVLFLLVIVTPRLLRGSDVKLEDLVAKHLDSIGSVESRNGLKSRVVQGAATYRILVGGSGAIDGKYVFASEGPKSNYLFKINTNGYRGEQFIWDGNKISIAGTYADKSRSEFGDFVLGQDIAVRENLLGGVWSSEWPLCDVGGHKAKLHYEGLKKTDGQEFLVLRYQPKRNTDLDISLYFSPQTYRHVMTTYKAARVSGLGQGEIGTARKQNTLYAIEERFSDFQTTDGLTLPTHYDLRFTEELDNGFTKAVEWDVKAMSIMNNISINAQSFQVK